MQILDYNEAIFASNLTANAKLTALTIASYYNWKENAMCWPSNKTLATNTSLSISSVTRAKKELVSQGYLQVWRRIDNSNMYRPLVPENAPISIKITEPVLLEQRVYANSSTNNEYNNEINNEMNNEINAEESKDSSKESNDSFDTIKEFSLSKIDNNTENVWSLFENR